MGVLHELAVGELAGQPDIVHPIASFREAEVRLGHTNEIGKGPSELRRPFPGRDRLSIIQRQKGRLWTY
jgi:hypothetical protein